MTYKKKLIEVALPLEAINRESAREKSIRHGHPSTLHLWWARKPLAACRAILFASYVDDPSAHPERFPTEQAQQLERERLFKIIEEIVPWQNASSARVLSAARKEILRSVDGEPPPVCDPFCGGGSIPLEAQRLGLVANAFDLNPVAVLITKALTEIPPRFAGRRPVHPHDGKSKALESWTGALGLADDIRFYGRWLRDEAERRIGGLYPKATLPHEHGGGQADVIAWLWARTVKSPDPSWGGPMPLVGSFALSNRRGQEAWVQALVDRERRLIHFAVGTGPGCPDATVKRSGATCIATNTAVPLSYIRAEAQAGRMGSQLMAIVADGPAGRIFLPPSQEHESQARSVTCPDDAPDFELATHPQYMGTPRYGLTHLRQIFTNRQLRALCALSDLVGEVRQRVLNDSADDAYADAVTTYMALVVDRIIDRHNALTTWDASPSKLQVRGVFARQAMPMSWNFAESNPLSSSSGGLGPSIEWVARVVERLAVGPAGHVKQLDAAALAADPPPVYVSDPPYYDNVPYGDLSDFFYVWLRRAVRSLYPDEFSTLLVPKAQELVADVHRYGSKEAAREHFEVGIRNAFERMASTQAAGFPLTVIYAFKETEELDGVSSFASTGWATMLDGLIRSGLSITGTWPLRSELSNRARSLGSNTLASSIALVCRPRPDTASLATRKEFVAALRLELPGALRRLQQGNIAPVDLAQAAIGPGMSVFSRYSKVVEADGSAMTVRSALALINQVLDETLAEQEADFDADTRWALAWFDQFGMSAGLFGVAETLSKAKNTAINGLVSAGILESRAGKVRLLDRRELSPQWDPISDGRLTIWEVAQHLLRALELGGENEAADLLRRVGGMGDTARGLAYRLYTVCERKKWTRDALAYNSLVVAWPEISRLAASAVSGDSQRVLEL